MRNLAAILVDPTRGLSGVRGDFMAACLYETIGGKSTILAAVNAFYRRVFADKTLAPFFKQTDSEKLYARQAMFLAMLLGGGDQDSSGQIRAAHEGSRAAGLTDAHFDAFLNHFRGALEEAGVAPDPLKKIMKLLEGTRAAVLNH